MMFFGGDRRGLVRISDGGIAARVLRPRALAKFQIISYIIIYFINYQLARTPWNRDNFFRFPCNFAI